MAEFDREPVCPQCGSAVVGDDLGRKKIYCGKACKQKADIAKKKARYVHKGMPQRTWYDKICLNCDTPFRTIQPKAKFCGMSCASTLKSVARVEQSIRDRTRVCQRCGVTFVMRAKNDSVGKYCSYDCAHAARRKPAGGIVSNNCVQCGTAFTPVPKTQRLCSADCRAEWNRRKARDHKRLAAVVKDPTPRSCRECGGVFVPVEYGDKRRAFCGKSCSDKHMRRIGKGVRRARTKMLPFESIDPFVVFERDGWTCHVCKLPTPRELRGTLDDRAPQLDHLMPLALGGSHTYANTACCCRACNIEKGAKLLDLVAAKPEDGGF